jgi:fucose 4-O-acetylase-like acetyltransferase
VQLNQDRVAFVDYGKGFCIVMVVMMHSVLGVEQAAGATSFMGPVVAFARPFRMPDFFLISGLFLSRVIDRDWRDYLDRKVLHFVYFYALWVTIQFAFKAFSFADDLGWAGVAQAYAISYVEPFGTLWFIYLLPIFFVVTKALRNVPPLLMWSAAALLQIADIHTGSTVIDEFSARFVYFYSGYVLAPYVFAFAARVAEIRRAAIVLLMVWAVFEAAMVFMGYSALPVVSLALGFIGALAVVALSVLLSTTGAAKPALCRAKLDRDLSCLLPADGRDADCSAEIRAGPRPWYRGAHRHHHCRDHSAHSLRGGEGHEAQLPVQAPGLGAAHAFRSPARFRAEAAPGRTGPLALELINVFGVRLVALSAKPRAFSAAKPHILLGRTSEAWPALAT